MPRKRKSNKPSPNLSILTDWGVRFHFDVPIIYRYVMPHINPAAQTCCVYGMLTPNSTGRRRIDPISVDPAEEQDWA